MSSLPEHFPVEWLNSNDYELGRLLLRDYVERVAAKNGLDVFDIPDEFAELVRVNLLSIETDRIDDIPLEKALHLAAKGDFERAGHIFRSVMHNGVQGIKLRNQAEVGARRIRQMREFGQRGADARKGLKDQHAAWERAAETIVHKRMHTKLSYRQLGKLVSQEVGGNPGTIRKHLSGRKILGK